MTWFKVDDNLAFHKKTLEAGNAAMGLWVRAGSWCGMNLTDGVIPRRIARQMGTKSQITCLLNAQLWHEHPDGYVFHEWSERQPSKADVEADRAETRKRVAEHRKRKREAKARAAEAESRDAESNAVTGRGGNTVTDARCNAVSNSTHARAVARPDPLNNYSPNAASPTYVPRASGEQPQQPSTHFSDDVPIPPEPDHDDGPAPLTVVPDWRPEQAIIDATPPPARGPDPTPAAQSLVRYSVPESIPRSVRRQLAAQVDKLTRDRNVQRTHIEAALRAWATKPGAGPRLLPNLVADAARTHSGTSTAGPATSKAQGWLDLANDLPDLPDHPKELP